MTVSAEEQRRNAVIELEAETRRRPRRIRLPVTDVGLIHISSVKAADGVTSPRVTWPPLPSKRSALFGLGSRQTVTPGTEEPARVDTRPVILPSGGFQPKSDTGAEAPKLLEKAATLYS
jgi:hypothetical protein